MHINIKIAYVLIISKQKNKNSRFLWLLSLCDIPNLSRYYIARKEKLRRKKPDRY